jgi:hypothetical protein
MSRRHSRAEQAEALKKAEALLKDGFSTAWIARELGVSPASYFRWQRHAAMNDEALEHSSLPPNALANSSIEHLLQDSSGPPRIDDFIAAFKFASWLRWPSQPRTQLTATAAYLICYIRRATGATYLMELDAPILEALARHVTLADLDNAYKSQLVAPNFDDWSYQRDFTQASQRFYDRDAIALIVHFLIAKEHTRRSHRSSPRWPVEDTYCRSTWRALAPAAPFLYVERFHSRLTWDLNPDDLDFLGPLSELFEDRAALHTFFANSLWVIERLRERLDPRAAAIIDFPTFPSWLTPKPIDPPPLPGNVFVAIDSY